MSDGAQRMIYRLTFASHAVAWIIVNISRSHERYGQKYTHNRALDSPCCCSIGHLVITTIAKDFDEWS